MMDGEAVLLVRMGGYILNIFLLSFVALRFRQHLVLFGWIAFLAVTVVVVWLRYLGDLQTYLALLDYGLTPLLYVNAFWMLWALLRQSRPK